MSTKKVLNIRELSDYLGISTSTLYRMMEDGRFSVKPVKGTKLYSVEKVDEWVNSEDE